VDLKDIVESDSEPEASPPATAPKAGVFRWHKCKSVIPPGEFTLDEAHPGGTHSNVDKLLHKNTYARVLNRTGEIFRGIRSTSGTTYVLVDQDDEIISEFLANSTLPKVKNLRQVTTIKMAEATIAYYKDNNSSKLDPTMRSLFGGGNPTVLLTTTHAMKILSQKAKRKRTVDGGAPENSKRRAAEVAPLTESINVSGISAENVHVLNFLTAICMPMIKAAKVEFRAENVTA
jgi:hypothetical protein